MPHREKRTPQQMADRFRFYAAMCREQAGDLRWPEDERENFLVQAARWERDAAIVLRDAELISETRAMLAEVDTVLERRL